ncbi:MAG: WxcM-like domain-containing protein [Cyanobacteria bacterium J06635_1]
MTSEPDPFSLRSTYVVLGDNGDAIPLTVSDRFFEDLKHKFGDFKGKRLVSCFTFDKDWDTWEIHPAGEELVCLLSGQVNFILEQGGVDNTLPLNTPGSFVLIPRNTWHTAKIYTPSAVLFITPGEGTQNRPV